MPYVEVPGIDHKVWVELHEPEDSGLPWFAEVGTEVKLTPEQFIQAQQDDKHGFVQAVEVLRLVRPTNKDEHAQMMRSATSYEAARRKLIKGKSGRPRVTFEFSEWVDFAILVRYFKSRGFKQASKQADKQWPLARSNGRSNRHLREAICTVDGWLIRDSELYRVAETVRKRRGLGRIPTARAPQARGKAN